MLGVFNLNFDAGSEQTDIVSLNHLTTAGMDALFNLKKLNQPFITAPNTALYNDTINYFFVIYDDGQPLGFDLNDKDVTFAQIARFPNTYNRQNLLYNSESASTGNIANQTYPAGKDEVKILAAGMAYKEIHGDGTKDFVWSITPLANPVVLKKKDTAENPTLPQRWSVSYKYRLVLTGNIVPEIKFNAGGEEYTFIRDPMANEIAVGYFTPGRNLLERRDVDQAAFTINGARFAAPSDFKEIKTDNPLIRKFEITYTNRRAANSCDVTGFSMMIGGTLFGWRLEHGRYIVLAAGKKFKVSVVVGIENGNPAAITTNGINYAPTPYYERELGEVSVITLYNLDNVKIDTIYLTGSANTPKELVSIKKLKGDENFVYIGDIPKRAVYNDELTKLELELGGVKGRGTYLLMGGDPSVVNMEHPDISAADCGWRYENDKVSFRINVPADISHLQCALDDGVWHDIPVTAGASNELTLPKRFFYNFWMFIRWKSGTKTGKIVKYTTPLTNRGLLVEPFYRIYENTVSNNASRMYYQTVALSGAGYGSKTTFDNTVVDTNNGTIRYGIDGGSRGVMPGSEVETNYNQAFTGKPVALLAGNDYLSNNLTLVKEAAFASLPNKSTGKQSDLSWQTRPVRPLASDVAVHVANPNLPRSLQLDLKPYPTVAIPSTVTIHATTQTRRARIRRLHDDHVIATVETPLKGQKLKFTLAEKLYNHIDYGVEYIGDSGEVLSPAPAVFLGGSLAVPDQITDYAYDDVNYVISFTTPNRAMRASIKQFDIEVYSFECVQGGVTKFYMSKPLNMTQRYELWLYNANGETWDEPYVMVDNEEVDEKPTSTGPYLFPEWTPAPGADTIEDFTYANNVFADVQRWVRAGMVFGVRINGKATDQVITRNAQGLIMRIAFNSDMQRFVWRTGYEEAQQSYTEKPLSTSGVEVTYMDTTPGPVMVIDVWHEWEKYSLIDEATYGAWKQTPAFVPYFGQTTGKFQKTEIINGYIRNTVRFRVKPARLPRICPLYHLQADKYSNAFRTAGIFIHPNDMVSSTLLGRTGLLFDQIQPIIDGKEAKWEYTRNADGNVEGIIRCFNNDQTAFRFDTANPANGWSCENYDPDLEGKPGSELLYHMVEFCASKGIWDGQNFSFSYNQLYGDKPGNADGETGSNKYGEALFAKVNMYAPIATFEDVYGGNPSTANYWENNPPSTNKENYRFQDAFVNVVDYEKFKTQVNDSVAYINGEKCVITTTDVTLTYKPNNVDNLYPYTNALQPGDINSHQEPVLEPYTYQAYILTAPNGTVLSNRTNPYVWTCDNRPTNVKGNLKVVIGRKLFSEEPYTVYSSPSSDNVNSNTGLFYSLNRKYWAALTFILHDVPHKLLKVASDVPDPSTIEMDESKSIFGNKVLHTLVAGLSSQAFIFEGEDRTFRPIPEIAEESTDFIIIDGRPFTIQFNPDLLTLLPSAKYPYQRSLTVYAVRIFDAADPNIYLEYDFLGKEKVVGLLPGVHKVSFANNTDGVSSWMLDTCRNFVTNLKQQGQWDLGLKPEEYGFLDILAINYIVSDIATGLAVSANVMPFTVVDPSTSTPEFIPDFGPDFEKTAPMSANFDIPFIVNPYYTHPDAGDPITVTLNGVAATSVTHWLNEDAVQPTPEGEPEQFDRSDMTLLQSTTYFWADAKIALVMNAYPENSRTVLHADVTDPEQLGPTVDRYTGPRLAFKFEARPYELQMSYPFVNIGASRQITYYGMPLAHALFEVARVQSVNNGSEIYTRLEIVLGRSELEDEDFDPSIGPSFNGNLTETALFNINPNTMGSGLGANSGGPGPIVRSIEVGPPGPPMTNYPGYPYLDDGHLVPNWLQFSYKSWGVTVNNKPAVFIAPTMAYDPKYSNLRLDTRLNSPVYMSGQYEEISLKRAILVGGELEPLGDLPEFYDPSFIGPGNGPGEGPVLPEPSRMMSRMASNPPNPEDIVGYYIADIDPALHLNNNYDYTDIPAIICEELDLILVWDYNLGEWVVYTGSTDTPYIIEFRYKRPWTPNNLQGSLVLSGSSFMGGRDIDTNFNFLTWTNFQALPNRDDKSKLNLSYVNMVSPKTNEGDAGYIFKGYPIQRLLHLEDHIPENVGLDETFVRLPTWSVTADTLLVTINKEPAIPDLTNYSQADKDHDGGIVYTITEVAVNNVYPTLGSMGHILYTNIHGVIKYDVATGTWTLNSSDKNADVTVGLVNVGCMMPVYSRTGNMVCKTYGRGDYSTAAAFRLKAKPTTPVNAGELIVPKLHDELMLFKQAAGGYVVPNYELFDPLKFELKVDGTRVITPNVVRDTHNVITALEYRLTESDAPESEQLLIIDIETREIVWSQPPKIPKDFGVLPVTRTDNLLENSDTRMFYIAANFTLQWTYTEQLDINDTRPLFVSGLQSPSTAFAFEFMQNGILPFTAVSGDKKVVSVAFAALPYREAYMSGVVAEQPFYGWRPTGYTGQSFSIEGNGNYVYDAAAARNLDGSPTEHTADTDLSANGLTNYQAM